MNTLGWLIPTVCIHVCRFYWVSFLLYLCFDYDIGFVSFRRVHLALHKDTYLAFLLWVLLGFGLWGLAFSHLLAWSHCLTVFDIVLGTVVRLSKTECIKRTEVGPFKDRWQIVCYTMGSEVREGQRMLNKKYDNVSVWTF